MKEKIKNIFKKGKWLSNLALTILLMAIVVAVTVGINAFVSSRNLSKIDLTKEKLYSLSQESKDKIKNIQQDTKIILYGMDSYTEVTNYANLYNKENSHITSETLENPLDRSDLQKEYGLGTNVSSLIVIECGNRKKAVMTSDLYTTDYTTYSQIDLTEQALTNAILSVNLEKTPKVYFVTNHAKYAEHFTFAKEYIKNEVYEVDDLDLLVRGEVPSDCDLLILTTPEEDFSEYEKDLIVSYLNSGKNMMVLSDPNYEKVDLTNFNSILALYGVSESEGIIYESSTSKMLNGYANIILPQVSSYSEITSSIAKSDGVALMNSGVIKVATSDELSNLGVTTETLISNNSTAFLRNNTSLTTASKTDEDEDAGGEAISVLATRNLTTENEDSKKSTLLIVGNSFFASDLTVMLYNKSSVGTSTVTGMGLYDNRDMLLNSIGYLTQRTDMITVRKDLGIVAYTATAQQDQIIRTIIVAIPVVVILAGIVVWQVRRRKK